MRFSIVKLSSVFAAASGLWFGWFGGKLEQRYRCTTAGIRRLFTQSEQQALTSHTAAHRAAQPLWLPLYLVRPAYITHQRRKRTLLACFVQALSNPFELPNANFELEQRL